MAKPAFASSARQGTPYLIHSLAAEWDRLELLVQICTSHRRNAKVPEAQMESLREATEAVIRLRKNGIWAPIEQAGGLSARQSPLLYDALAAIILPLARPAMSLGLIALQHPGLTEPAPSAALIYDVLALEGQDDPDFHRVIDDLETLAQRGIVQSEGTGALRFFRPGAVLTSLLFGSSRPIETPPGVTRITGRPSLDSLMLDKAGYARIEELLQVARFKQHLRGQGELVGGPIALLAGGPGTGKSMAARALSATLGTPLYRVDFGMVMSKWVGETERNFNHIFEALHGLGATLMIDEADALLGKRVSVKEGRDQYVNATVGHLLARFEQHDGLVFLTSNLVENIDEAYFRRFDFVIGFSRPAPAARRSIWAQHIPEAECGEHREDLVNAAASVALSGGQIANAALVARAFAHAGEAPINHGHVARAVWRELTKTPRTLSRRDLKALAPHMPDAGEGDGA